MSPKGSTESSPLMASVSAGGFWRTNLGLFIIIGGDFCTSLSINFYNSWLMRQVPGFNFPLIYTCLHMVASFLFASLLVFGFRVAPANWEQARALVLRIVLLAFLRGASIATNNWSLEYISIALNKVIKASVPVFTVPLSILFERKRYSPYKIVALLCLASGTMLSCVLLSGQAADAKGILLAFISAAVGGSSIVVGAMLMGKGTGLGPVSVLLYMSPCQVLMLASVVPFDELPPFLDFVRDHDGSTMLYLAVGTLLAVAFNLMSYVQLQSTSSVTSSMLGNLKIVSIILIYEAGLRPVQVEGGSRVDGDQHRRLCVDDQRRARVHAAVSVRARTAAGPPAPGGTRRDSRGRHRGTRGAAAVGRPAGEEAMPRAVLTRATHVATGTMRNPRSVPNTRVAYVCPY